ncbi:MAG: sel1 repeat family protein [Neisseriaceae bacterium]|nr:sel1 repeat family protein [Neisseriaceae bacterium]
MKRKLLLLAACFSFALSPLAMAESAEDLFYQGVHAHKQGNYSQAAKLFGKACHGGNAKGCYNLGVLYANGQGKRQNLSSAKEYYGKACDLGLQGGCDWYKKLNMQGY